MNKRRFQERQSVMSTTSRGRLPGLFVRSNFCSLTGQRLRSVWCSKMSKTEPSGQHKNKQQTEEPRETAHHAHCRGLQ